MTGVLRPGRSKVFHTELGGGRAQDGPDVLPDVVVEQPVEAQAKPKPATPSGPSRNKLSPETQSHAVLFQAGHVPLD